jgi:hypothetical protein
MRADIIVTKIKYERIDTNNKATNGKTREDQR